MKKVIAAALFIFTIQVQTLSIQLQDILIKIGMIVKYVSNLIEVY